MANTAEATGPLRIIPYALPLGFRKFHYSMYLAQARETPCLRRYNEPLCVEPPYETNGGSSR
jgi:hypothetical protein